MDENKVLKCQKYYIFKVRDIVHNSFHILEEKMCIRDSTRGQSTIGKSHPYFCSITYLLYQKLNGKTRNKIP